jgi:hypothetical protein
MPPFSDSHWDREMAESVLRIWCEWHGRAPTSSSRRGLRGNTDDREDQIDFWALERVDQAIGRMTGGKYVYTQLVRRLALHWWRGARLDLVAPGALSESDCRIMLDELLVHVHDEARANPRPPSGPYVA